MKGKNNLRFIIYLCCFVTDLIAWAITLLIKAICGGTLEIRQGVLFLFSKKQIPYVSGLTLGHAIIIEEDKKDNERLIKHELFHVKQLEAASVMGAILAAIFVFIGLRWSLLIFSFMPWISYYTASLTAWMLGGRAYFDNHLEIGARGESSQ